MLKLIYSPYYDGNCYAGNPEKQQCTLGTKYVGDIGLLNELELRAGLSRGDVSPMRRAIEYCNAIQQVLNSNPTSNPFYKQSFLNDPLGVARQLLSWRDALAMAGWSKQTKLPNTLSSDGKKRLTDLQEIEQYFDFIGIGERWQELLQIAQQRPILPQGTTITVEMKWNLLHPVIKKVFEAINKQMSDTVKESEAVVKLNDDTLDADKFILYEFPEQNDAYQWAALQNYENAVFVNEDNFTFNQVLKSLGKPVVGASIKGSIPEMSQLLKLGISLFRSPVNYDNLIDYLSIFRHPIDRDTLWKLRNHLQAAGGFGEHQGNAFPTVDPSYNDVWGMWDKCISGSNGSEVGIKEVKTYCDTLLKWTETAMTKATAEKVMNPYVGTQICSQISILQEQIRSLQAFLKGKTGKIKNDELDKIVVPICQGDAVTTDQARLGSYDMLKDIKVLACEVGKVVWMDCVGKLRPHYAYSFMNPKDIQALQQNDLNIPNPELEMKASDFAEKLAVSRAKLIIALMPKRKDGERTEENLLITELCANAAKVSINRGVNCALPNTDTCCVTSSCMLPQEVEYQLKDKTLLNNIDKPDPNNTSTTTGNTPKNHTVGYKRHYESASSLEKLINQPFDYLLEYIFNLKEDGSSNISNIEGNVAHDVISKLLEQASTKNVCNTKQFLSLCKNQSQLIMLINRSILNRGVELLLPENQMEYNAFVRILSQKSIPSLAKIIEDNGLEVEGSEIHIRKLLNDNASKPIFILDSKIDFVLKKNDEEGKTKYYIFDFKWTTHPNKRKDELATCKELQLALYKKIFEEDKGSNCVEMYGYYLLKQTKLLTSYDKFKSNPAIEIITQKDIYPIFNQVVESYRQRIQNLKDGFIEEGEDMHGSNFDSTKFFQKYFLESLSLGDITHSFFLNNNLKIGFSKAQAAKAGKPAKPAEAKMMAPAKDKSYNHSVLKNKCK